MTSPSIAVIFGIVFMLSFGLMAGGWGFLQLAQTAMNREWKLHAVAWVVAVAGVVATWRAVLWAIATWFV